MRQEFQSSLESKRRDFKKAFETLEKQQLQAIKALEHSLDLFLKVHNCPKAHLERGAFYFLEGRTLSALEHVYKAIRLKDDLQALREETLLLKSQVEAEAGLYVEAITTLTELVQKNPSHKEAYFERASAYFEVGDFDLALQDYLSSDFKSTSAEALAKDMTLFAAGLLTGAVQGGI